jgi:hypothetical protein
MYVHIMIHFSLSTCLNGWTHMDLIATNGTYIHAVHISGRPCAYN